MLNKQGMVSGGAIFTHIDNRLLEILESEENPNWVTTISDVDFLKPIYDLNKIHLHISYKKSYGTDVSFEGFLRDEEEDYVYFMFSFANVKEVAKNKWKRTEIKEKEEQKRVVWSLDDEIGEIRMAHGYNI